MNKSSQPMSSTALSSERRRPRCAPGVAARHLAAWLAALACAAPATAQQVISGDVVKIGVLTDMSGAYSDFTGSGAVIAAKTAVDDFSTTGKVLGNPLKLSVRIIRTRPTPAHSVRQAGVTGKTWTSSRNWSPPVWRLP